MSNATKLVASRPRSTKAAPVVEVIAAAPETAPKPKGKQGGAKPETFVEQGYVDSFINAESDAKEAAVALFVACTLHRVSPAQFKDRSDAKVRASEFNTAFHAAKLLGRDRAIKAINAAAGKGGDKRANVLAALRNIKSVAPQLKGSALRGAALQKEIAQRADRAAEQAAKDHADRRAAAKQNRVARVPEVKSNTVQGFVPVLMAALTDALSKMAKIEVRPSELAKWKELSGCLSESVDICGSFKAVEA